MGTNDAGLRLERPLVDGLHEPCGLDAEHPRFSWTARGGHGEEATAEVALVALDGSHRWASGPRRLDVGALTHDGAPLPPLTAFTWTVTHRLADGTTADASSRFSTGLTGGVDWAGATWLTAPPAPPTHPRGATPAPELFTDVVVATRPTTALLFVAAGGYARPSVNGVPASDVELSPAFSDYDVRLHYRAYDVAALLAPGRNRIGLLLGRGFYGMTNPSPPPAWGWESAPWHDEPCVLAVLHLVEDGVHRAVPTGSDWRCRRSTIAYDDLYAGEVTDMSLDAAATPAALARGPRGALQFERLQPIRVIGDVAPTGLTRRGPGDWVLDFGRVLAGRVRLTLPAGDHDVVVTHGEKLTADGLPNVADGEHYFSDGFQTDRFIGAGPCTWEPTFTYHGFRYAHVTGRPDLELTASDATARIVHTDLATLARFRCSDDLLNRLHEAAVETVRINLHGLPTDTPTYEKNGWTGDGMLAAELMLTNLDAEPLLVKWLDDIADTLDADGRPQIIAPSPGWGDWYKPSPTWHADFVLTPWWLHLHRGNRDVLARHYAAMRRYVLLELSVADGGLADTVLNDWCSPETDPWGGRAPDDHRVSGTAYLHVMLATMARIAEALGHEADRAEFTRHAASVREAFNAAFLAPDRRSYVGRGDEGYRQTHTLLALAFDLAPADAVAGLVAELVADLGRRGDHLNTGVLGSKYLLPMLTRHGHGDLALRVARQRTVPSWGYWIEQGSSTLWEHWSPESRSRAHYMFGTFDDWFFADVLGVTPLEPGYRRFRVAPADLAGLDHAEGEVPTPSGPITVAWRNAGARRLLRVDVPVGCRAEVDLLRGAARTRRLLTGGSYEMEVG